MIKLKLPEKPSQLTDDLKERLTREFSETGKRVWDIPWLKDAILEMSFGKCCYSEIRLNEESKYMEVEHFYPKSKYPDKVMEWGNLLPSCKTCNGSKGEHDTLKEPILNPFFDNPKDHLRMINYRFYPRNGSAIGKRTIDVLDLNNELHLMVPRFQLGNQLLADLKNLAEELEEMLPNVKRRFFAKLKGVLQKGNRRMRYSAMVSTLVLSDHNYKAIEACLRSSSLWDEELQMLKEELQFCAMLE